MMIILSKWNKIYVFSIVQHSKIPEIHSHIIVAGNGDDQRFRDAAPAASGTRAEMGNGNRDPRSIPSPQRRVV